MWHKTDFRLQKREQRKPRTWGAVKVGSRMRQGAEWGAQNEGRQE